MLPNSLHSITIEELSNSNQHLYFEYEALLDYLDHVISNGELDFRKIIAVSKKYDERSNEAYIQLFLDNTKNPKLDIYIHKNFKQFIVGHDGNGKPLTTASKLIQEIKNQLKD